MTHDELLARINEASPADKIDASWQSALRAVVELHKPKHKVTPTEIYCDCGIGYLQAYPCPTIEAIEKELN